MSLALRAASSSCSKDPDSDFVMLLPPDLLIVGEGFLSLSLIIWGVPTLKKNVPPGHRT